MSRTQIKGIDINTESLENKIEGLPDLALTKLQSADGSMRIELTSVSLDDTNLIAHWKMNDNSSSSPTVTDSTGNHNGTYKDALGNINTSVGSVPGKINSALNFNGVDQYVEVADHADFTLDGDKAIALWCKVDALQQGGLVTMDDSAGSPRWFLYLDEDAGVYRFRFAVEDNANNVGPFALNDNVSVDTWYFVVAMYDQSERNASIYVFDSTGLLDGGSEANSSLSSSINPAVNLVIGELQSINDHFDGQIDDVRIYDSLLSMDQIRAIWNEGNGTEAGTVSSDVQKFYMNSVEVAKIHNSGAWSFSKQISLSYGKGSSQDAATGVWTAVEFTTELWDYQNNWSGTLFVAPEPGIYHVDFGITLSAVALSEGEYARAGVHKNGAVYKSGVYDWLEDPVTKRLSSVVSCDVDMEIGDYIELKVYQNSGGAVSIFGNTDYSYMNIRKVN